MWILCPAPTLLTKYTAATPVLSGAESRSSHQGPRSEREPLLCEATWKVIYLLEEIIWAAHPSGAVSGERLGKLRETEAEQTQRVLTSTED